MGQESLKAIRVRMETVNGGKPKRITWRDGRQFEITDVGAEIVTMPPGKKETCKDGSEFARLINVEIRSKQGQTVRRHVIDDHGKWYVLSER